MAKYSSKDLDLTIDTTSMKAYIIDDVTLGIEVGTAEATAFGDTWESHISTGVSRGDPFTVGGYYDDTAATGPDAKLNALGTTVAVVITWGGTKTSTFNAIVKRYERVAKVKDMTRYVATLLPTGEVEEA